jgi:hypothetical protein
VENVMREINGYVDTFCLAGQGCTWPWDMDKADDYLNIRTGTTLRTDYNAASICETALRNRVRDSIVDRDTPAIIGTGFFGHYPVAYGYAYERLVVRTCIWVWCWEDTVYNRWFCVNQVQGGGGSAHEWVVAETWFAGEIFP